MIGKYPDVLNFNRLFLKLNQLFSNSTSSSGTNRRFFADIGGNRQSRSGIFQ